MSSQASHVVFYLTCSKVYHLVERSGPRPWDYLEITLCGWRYRNCKVKNPYYDAKLGELPRDAQGHVHIYDKRLCENCRRILGKAAASQLLDGERME